MVGGFLYGTFFSNMPLMFDGGDLNMGKYDGMDNSFFYFRLFFFSWF